MLARLEPNNPPDFGGALPSSDEPKVGFDEATEGVVRQLEPNSPPVVGGVLP